MKESVKERRIGQFMKLGELQELMEKREKFGIELRKQKRREGALTRRMRLTGRDGPISSYFDDKSGICGVEKELRRLRDLLAGGDTEEGRRTVFSQLHLILTSTPRPPSSLCLSLSLPQLLLPYIHLKSDHDTSVKALWILAIIAEESEEAAREVGGCGVLQGVEVHFTPPLSPTLLPASSLLCSLLHFSPSLALSPAVQSSRILSLSIIQHSLPIDTAAAQSLSRFLCACVSPDMQKDDIKDVTTALSLLLDSRRRELIDPILTSMAHWTSPYVHHSCSDDFLSSIVSSLACNRPTTLKPAMEILGKVATADEPRMLALIAAGGLLDRVLKLVEFPNAGVRVAGLNFLRSVVGASLQAAYRVISHPVSKAAILAFADPSDLGREAALGFCYEIARKRRWGLTMRLVEMGVIEEMGEIRASSSQEVLRVRCRQGVVAIAGELMEVSGRREGKDAPPPLDLPSLIHHSSLSALIHDYRFSPNLQIAEAAKALAQEYFSEEEGGWSEVEESVGRLEGGFEFS